MFMLVTGRVVADEETGIEMPGSTGRRITTALESRFTLPLRDDIASRRGAALRRRTRFLVRNARISR
jgi:hypothetical protein